MRVMSGCVLSWVVYVVYFVLRRLCVLLVLCVSCVCMYVGACVVWVACIRVYFKYGVGTKYILYMYVCVLKLVSVHLRGMATFYTYGNTTFAKFPPQHPGCRQQSFRP